MPLDIEMSDTDSLVDDRATELDPGIIASISPAPERVVFKCKEYFRRPAIRATETPSIIWCIGEEYERNKHRFWRYGICKKTKLLAMDKGTTSALRHLRKDHKIDKQGKRIPTK
jgi:hypothetical protein